MFVTFLLLRKFAIADGDGKLDASEIGEFMSGGKDSSNRSLNEEKVANALIKSFDKDNDGNISYEEFQT